MEGKVLQLLEKRSFLKLTKCDLLLQNEVKSGKMQTAAVSVTTCRIRISLFYGLFEISKIYFQIMSSLPKISNLIFILQ